MDNVFHVRVIRINCNIEIANFVSVMNRMDSCRCEIDNEGLDLIKFKCGGQKNC